MDVFWYGVVRSQNWLPVRRPASEQDVAQLFTYGKTVPTRTYKRNVHGKVNKEIWATYFVQAKSNWSLSLMQNLVSIKIHDQDRCKIKEYWHLCKLQKYKSCKERSYSTKDSFTVTDYLAEVRPPVSPDHTILRRMPSFESLLVIVAGKNSLCGRRSWFLCEDLIVALEVMST